MYDDPSTVGLKITENNKDYTMKLKIRGSNVIGIGVSTGQSYTQKNYYGEFSLDDLRRINKVFILTETIGDVQDELEKCVKQKKVGLTEKEDFCHIMFYLELGTDLSHLSIAVPRNEEPRIIELERRHQLFKVEEDNLRGRIRVVDGELKKIQKDQDEIMRETQTLNGEADQLLNSIPSYGNIPGKIPKESLRSKRPVPLPQPQPYIPPEPTDEFPNGIKKGIIRNEDEIYPISDKIKQKCGAGDRFNCLYRGSEHGDSAEEFHRRCDNARRTMVLVETTDGKRFGGFTQESWGGQKEKRFDDSAFVFKIPDYGNAECFDVVPGKEAIAAYKYAGPCFCGCQIRIYDRFRSDGGSTFKQGVNYQTRSDFELTDGQQTFGVNDVEVYEVY